MRLKQFLAFVCSLIFCVLVVLIVIRSSGSRATYDEEAILHYLPVTYSTLSRVWPPKYQQDLHNIRQGVMHLGLNPIVDVKVKDEWVYDRAYDDLLKALSGTATDRNLTMIERLELDKANRVNGDDPNFALYPQSIDLRKTVDAIRSGRPISHAPLYDRRYSAIRTPKTLCISYKGAPPQELAVFIRTCPSCYENRQRIRATFMQPHLWGDFRIRITFVVGTTANKTMAHIYDESDQYDDMLIGNVIDRYNTLTEKLFFTFRWATALCCNSTPLFLFMDDDLTLVPRAIARVVRQLPEHGRRYFVGGLFHRTIKPVRPDNSGIYIKWEQSIEEYPFPVYPPFHYGFGCFIGSEILIDASIAMAFVKPITIDDAYLGMVWTKLSVPLFGLHQFTLNGNPTDFKETVAMGFSKNMDQYIDWDISCSPAMARKVGKVCVAFV